GHDTQLRVLEPDPVGLAGDRRDLVAGLERLSQELSAGTAGGPEDGQSHHDCSDPLIRYSSSPDSTACAKGRNPGFPLVRSFRCTVVASLAATTARMIASRASRSMPAPMIT